jgi:hypothetical protein
VAVSLAAELGEGEVVLWDDLASLMLRLPEAEAKEWAKRVAVISENKTAKQERKWRHGRTGWCAHLERWRENAGKFEESRNSVLTWTLHVQENRFADVEQPKERELS